MARGRAAQPYSVGLFIKEHLMVQGEDYPERVHHFYTRALRQLDEAQMLALIAARPDLEGRFIRESYTDPREEVHIYYRLATKRRPGRPSRPYRLARYHSFMATWHKLVKIGALAFTREEPALGRIDTDEGFRIQDEALRGVAGWEAVPQDRRPKRRYYQLTNQGQTMDDGIWLAPQKYLRLEIMGLVADVPRFGLIPFAPVEMLPPEEIIVPVRTAEALLRLLETRLRTIAELATRANQELEAGLTTETILGSVAQGLGSLTASVSQFQIAELMPAMARAVPGVEEVAARAEREIGRLAALTLVLAPSPDGLAGMIERISVFTLEEFTMALEEMNYQLMAGHPLLALIFGLPAPESIPRSRAAPVLEALRAVAGQIGVASRNLRTAIRLRDLEARERWLREVQNLSDNAIITWAIPALGIPYGDQHTAALWKLALLARLRDASPPEALQLAPLLA